MDLRNALGTNYPDQFQFTGICIIEPAFFKYLPVPGTVESVVPAWLRAMAAGERIGGTLTDGTKSVLSGNIADVAPASAVDVCGNGATLAGQAAGTCENDVKSTTGGYQGTLGDDSVGSANIAQVPVAAPAEVYGLAAALGGQAAGSADEVKLVRSSGTPNTADDNGTVSSNIVTAPTAVAPQVFAVDEAPRRDTSLEKLAQLEPAFVPDGKITAGNSSQIVDGAAAMLIASEHKASELGLEARGRFLGFGLSGVDPYRMLHGNPQACERALAKAGLGWDDMAVIEVNEAYASVVLQFVRDAGLEDRLDDVNPNGGGISLGHPLGATGARIIATLLSELERRGERYGIATMCIGFGQALAGVVERL
jgi:hypothetical protein